MQKILRSIIPILLFVTLTACGKDGSSQIATPWLEHETLGEACCAVNFNMTFPEHIDGYSDPIFRTLYQEIIEIIYPAVDDEICIRKYASAEDRIQDFGGIEAYPYGGYATEAEHCYQVLGTDPDTINLVSWGDDAYHFIFFCKNGFTDSDALFDMIHQVK